MKQFDLVVVGSGVIGLSLATKFRQDGRSVALLDPNAGSGASSVAAGMLAPVTEAAYGEEEISRLAIRSASAWPEFATNIESLSGLSVGYLRNGTLLVAAESSDAADLNALLSYHEELGLESRWIGPSEARDVEPLLAPSIRGAIFAAGDGQVDNRKLLSALCVAADRLGVVRIRSRVEALEIASGTIQGVRTAQETIAAPVVVAAAGYSTGLLPGMPETARPPVRPVKGQILRVRVPSSSPRPSVTVRANVSGNAVYLVPRTDGQVVIGATVEDRGADRSITAGGVYGLLRDAIRVLPDVAEYELTEVSAGLRPGSFDNAAIVGPTEIDGLVLACGHYRNGILFAPLTVEIVSTLLDRGAMPSWASALAPLRALTYAASSTPLAR